MTEEELQGEQNVEGQTPQPSEEEAQRTESRAEQRIQELARRNQELEKLVNMSQRIEQVEQQQQQSQMQQQQVQQQRAVDPEIEQWVPWIRPKVEPILQEYATRIQHAFLALADKQDYLATMMNFPEYRDEETQREVEQLRQMRLKQTGQLETREAVLYFLRGQKVDKIADERAKKLMEEKQRGAEGSYIESGSGVGATRAASGVGQKSFEDLSPEEMDRFLVENKVKF